MPRTKSVRHDEICSFLSVASKQRLFLTSRRITYEFYGHWIIEALFVKSFKKIVADLKRIHSDYFSISISFPCIVVQNSVFCIGV